MINTVTKAAILAMSVVANVGDDTAQVVTNCVPEGGQGWLDLFSIPTLTKEMPVPTDYDLSYIMPINLDTMADIHSSWGVAWYDADSVVHTAGSNPIYAERAKRNLMIHVILQDGLVGINDPDPQSNVTLFVADAPSGGRKASRPRLRRYIPLKDLPSLLEAHGIELTDTTWAFGVKTPEGVDLVLSYDVDRAVGVLAQLEGWCDRD